MKFLKSKLEKIMTNNFLIAIYAFLIAIVAWFVISITIYPSTPKTYNNIPIDLDISQTAADENGLSVISCDVEKVNVQIEGDRSQIGNLPKGDLVARIDASTVFRSGQKKLNIKIVSKSGVKFKVKKITPPTASVLFDTMETKEFPLTPSTPNLIVADGKSSQIQCVPDTIKVKGPSSQLAQIAKCEAVVNKSDKLSQSYVFDCDEVRFYGETGAVLDNKSIEADEQDVKDIKVNVSVFTQKTLGLTVGFSNIPPDLDVDTIKLKFSEDSITLASETDSLKELSDKIEIKKIPIYNIDLDYCETLPVDDTSIKGYKNLSDFETVTVSLDKENYAKKEFKITEFTKSNEPANYDFDVITKELRVSIVGPKDVINSLTSKDLIADINLIDYETAMSNVPTSSSFEYPVTISCPNYNSVWAVGESKVMISRSPKSVSANNEE